jgi:hypothetical protein
MANTHVWHQSLEAHVFHSGNVLSPFKVFAGPVFPSLARIVYEVLGDFSESSSLFTEVDNNTAAALLGFLHSLFDSEDEVWPTGANVGSEDVATVAFVVDAEGELGAGVGHFGWVAEDVDG